MKVPSVYTKISKCGEAQIVPCVDALLSMPYPPTFLPRLSYRLILVLSFSLRLCVASSLSPSDILTKILCAFRIDPMHAACIHSSYCFPLLKTADRLTSLSVLKEESPFWLFATNKSVCTSICVCLTLFLPLAVVSQYDVPAILSPPCDGRLWNSCCLALQSHWAILGCYTSVWGFVIEDIRWNLDVQGAHLEEETSLYWDM